MARSRALDGVRGIAILAVMANHTGSAIGRGGYLGVDLFFVLSGYLITTILLREQARTTRISLRRFYMRRALRLYPALLTACIVAALFAPWVGYTDRGTGVRSAGVAAVYLTDAAIQWHWFAVNGLFHTWSLAIEEHFYMVWPALMVVLLASGRRRWLTWIAAAGGAYMLVATAIFSQTFASYRIVLYRDDTRGGALLVGCLLAIWFARKPVVLHPATAWCSLAVVLALFLVMRGDPNGRASVSAAMPVIWLLAAALIAELVASPDRRFARVLGWRPLAYIGLISYGLYLYHLLIYQAVSHQLGLTRRNAIPIEVVGSLIAAAMSYRYLETPFLRFKRHFASAGDAEPAHRTQVKVSP